MFGETAITDEAMKKMSVRYLPRIFGNSLVVTTNFDKVLEQVFLMEQHSFSEKVVLRHLTNWQAKHTQHASQHYLIKIHGCVSAPDEVVMTKTSYDELYRKDSLHIARLSSILSGNKLMFIGCGLKEDRTVDLLSDAGLSGHYAILEMNGEPGEAAFKKRKLFMSNDLKMHCIWYPKGEHHYVEDILEYIYADITGQLRAAEPDVPKTPRDERNPATVQTKKPAKTPKPAAKPLVKNEIYTIGRWNGKPLEWLILDVHPDRALLIAKDCLLEVTYSEEKEPVTWEQCSLRNKVLPQLMEQIFDGTERDRVLLWENQNPDDAYWNTPGGADTSDELFLLSIDEAKQYFPYDEARVAYMNGKAVWWWLRSPGCDPYYAASVDAGGSVFDIGIGVSWSGCAVRPAFWLNLKS